MDAPTLTAFQKPTRVRYGVLGFACVLSMITYLDRVCFGTVAAVHPERVRPRPRSRMGWLFTAFAFAYAVFEVPTGWLGDVFGARKTLIRIVLWWSVFTALTGLIYPTAGIAWSPSALLLAVRFLFGIGEAGAYPNIARAFHNWFPFERARLRQGGRLDGRPLRRRHHAVHRLRPDVRRPSTADGARVVALAAHLLDLRRPRRRLVRRLVAGGSATGPRRSPASTPPRSR